jgi:hypothetical protein
MSETEAAHTAEKDAGGMAAIIDRHEYDVDLSSGLPRPACACGWKAEREWSGTEVHSEHVEAVLRDAGYGLMAEAWDEGYRLDWTGGVKWHNPYRETR